MPLFIDIHEIPGITSEVAAAEHIKDIEAQGPFAVDYSRYWLNEATGKIFCLCEAPTADAAIAVHRQAHGVAADRIIEVSGELPDLFMGPTMTDAGGAVVLPTDLGRTHDTGTRTLLFTDIVESIALTNRLGDEGAMEVLAVHDEIVRAAIAQNGGREVKHTGDGIMAAFISAIGAVRCAVDSQRGLTQFAAEHPHLSFVIRIGIASGDPVGHHNDFFGATVQLAARLCAQAQPGQILCSQVVADLCVGKNLRFRECDPVLLKGFQETVAVRYVDWS